MFAVIYKGHVHQGVEAEYKRLWCQIAKYFIEHRGALGSCLHKTVDGEVDCLFTLAGQGHARCFLASRGRNLE